MKQCTKCKENKDLYDFYKNTKSNDGFRNICKKCNNKDHKIWTINNKEKSRIIKDRWSKNNPEKHKESGKKYRNNNINKIKTINRNYHDSNPGLKNSWTRKRQALKIQATPRWLSSNDHKLMNNFYVEAARLTKETGIPHHVDHIFPLQGENICGFHVPWNLQILTAEENIKKGNKL